MKLHMPLITVIWLALAACQSNTDDLSPKDLSAIKTSSAKWVETYNNNDWAALAELFAPDAIMMPPNSPEVIGRTAIADWEAKFEQGFSIAFDIQTIDGNADQAIVRGRSCVFIPLESGETGVDIGKFLEVRQKQPNGDWLITYDIFNSDLAMNSDLQDTCPFADKE